MAIYTGASKSKLFTGNTKVKRMYLGNDKIYSAGNIVTYIVDTNVSYQEEIDEGNSVLSPTTFMPSKTGWMFAGWRTDKTASTPLSSMIMGDNPITLYAVFTQTITLGYSGNGSTGGSVAVQTGTRYYNNGNYNNPTFVLRSNNFIRTGYSFSKWALGSATGTQYTAGASIALSASTTMYSVWTRNAITVIGDTYRYLYGGDMNGSSATGISPTTVDCTDFKYLKFTLSGRFYKMNHPTSSERTTAVAGLSGTNIYTPVIIAYWNNSMENNVNKFQYASESPLKGWGDNVTFTLNISALSGNHSFQTWAISGSLPQWDTKVKNLIAYN